MQPAEVNALSDELRAFTERAWQQLQDEQDAILASWPKASADARRKRLQDLQNFVGRLTSQVDELALALATGGLHTAYTLGAAAGGSAQFTAADVDALGVLAQDLYGDVLSSTRNVRESTKKLIRTLAREHVGDRLLGGQTSAEAARKLRLELESKSISAITYRDGSRHGLADYVDLVTRTKTAQAYSGGTLNAARKTGVTFMEVFDGYGCGWIGHSDPDKANGTIRTIEECATSVISHPRCVMPGQSFASYGQVTEGLRARYSGPAFTLKTAIGSLTVGPHHPVLTRRGWLPAHLLNEGDEVVYDQRLRRVADAGSAAGLNLEEMPLVEDAFVAGGPLGRGQLRADDLHGDAVFCEDEVDVVRPEGPLLVVDETSGVEQRCQLDLVGADRRLVDVASLGNLLGLLGCVRPVGLSGTRRLHSSRTLLERPPLPSHADARGWVARDPGLKRQPTDVGRAATKPSPDLVGAFAGKVGSDQHVRVVPSLPDASALSRAVFPRLTVVALEDLDAADEARPGWDHNLQSSVLQDIGQHFYVGWVYDFTTTEGAFNVGGFVVKNCTRAFAPRPDVANPDDAKAATRSQSASQAQDQRQVQIVRQARVEARARRLAARRQKIDARSGV